MQALRSGGSSLGRLVLVLFLAAGLTAPGAQQSTARRPEGTGSNGSPATGSVSPEKPADGSGTAMRRSGGSGSGAPQFLFASWLDSSPEGRRYQEVKTRVQELSDLAREQGIPLEVFMIRMKEAMAKNVAPVVFIGALEKDTAHWLRIDALLGETGWPPAAKAPDFYIAASNALRNGVTEETVSALIAWAMASGGTPERAAAVLMSVSSLTGLMHSLELSRAAGLIAASRLRVGDFDDLAALLMRGYTAGLSSAELLAAMEAVLGSRGTLRSLERRLFP
jgi:hypothetical protein